MLPGGSAVIIQDGAQKLKWVRNKIEVGVYEFKVGAHNFWSGYQHCHLARLVAPQSVCGSAVSTSIVARWL